MCVCVGAFGFVHALYAASSHYVCVHEKMSERADKKLWNNRKSEGDGASLFMHTLQTNSLCFSVLHQTYFIFLEHISRNQFWEMEGLDLFAWDKMGLCDHCR